MNAIHSLPMPLLGFLTNPAALGILLLVVVLLFGGKNIPELMKGLGQGMQEFKKGMEGEPVSSSNVTEHEQEERLRIRIDQEVGARMEAEKNQGRETL